MVETIGLTLVITTTIIFSIIGILYTRGRNISTEDYITARNSIKTGALIATLVASAMGSWILFSPPEVGVRVGITGLIGYSIGSALAIIIFAWLGVRIRTLMPNGHSLTEFVFLRFGKGMYVLVLLTIIFYMGVYLTAELTGISQAMNMLFGTPLIITTVIIGLGTLSYTAIGGLRASIFTDWIQYWFMLPLIALIFLGSSLYLNLSDVFAKASISMPEIFKLTHIPGIEYAITLIVAIIGAELFNQGNWQRVYSADSKSTLIKSFFIAGLIVIPIIFIVGLFGLFAVGTNTAENPSVALFTFLLKVTPKWILFTTMILVVILVMSTIDTLLNGLVSLFTVDIVRIKPKMTQKNILSIARWISIVIGGLAILISINGYSVLYLFLIADLVCVAVAFPTFYGFYSKKFSGRYAIFTSIIGIIAGASMFPDPTFSKGNLLWSFLIALIIPAILSPILAQFGKEYNFKELEEKVKEI